MKAVMSWALLCSLLLLGSLFVRWLPVRQQGTAIVFLLLLVNLRLLWNIWRHSR